MDDVLVPELKSRARLDLFKMITTDQYGHYELKTVAPGDYKLFAWGDVEAGAWQDPEFPKKYEARGVAVKVQSNGDETAKLKVLVDPEP